MVSSLATQISSLSMAIHATTVYSTMCGDGELDNDFSGVTDTNDKDDQSFSGVKEDLSMMPF